MTATISGDGTSTLINLTTSGNTILGDASTDTLNVGNGGLVKDASGNVGIGTASPIGKLDVATDGNTTAYLTYARNANAGSSAYAISGWGNNSSSNAGQVAISSTANTGYGGGGDFIFLANTGDMTLRTTTAKPMTFYTNGSERMRIGSSGNLLINTTSQLNNSNSYLNILYDGGNFYGSTFKATSSAGTAIAFINSSGTSVGSITQNNSATSYITSSDYRLKEDIAPMMGALAKVVLLKPCTYKWKVDGSDGQGFIAHELAEVVPDCVTGKKDAVDAEGNPQYQGIDTSFLVATLTAAIQELKALVDGQAVLIATQASTITALQADVEALKARGITNG